MAHHPLRAPLSLSRTPLSRPSPDFGFCTRRICWDPPELVVNPSPRPRGALTPFFRGPNFLDSAHFHFDSLSVLLLLPFSLSSLPAAYAFPRCSRFALSSNLPTFPNLALLNLEDLEPHIFISLSRPLLLPDAGSRELSSSSRRVRLIPEIFPPRRPAIFESFSRPPRLPPHRSASLSSFLRYPPFFQTVDLSAALCYFADPFIASFFRSPFEQDPTQRPSTSHNVSKKEQSPKNFFSMQFFACV